MALQLVTAPTADAIDLTDAKLHLRVTFPDDDLLIRALLRAACDHAQNFTRKQLVSARYKQVIDSFPAAGIGTSAITNTPFARPANAIYLERGPVNQVVSVNYLDMSGAQQVVSPSTYVVDYSTDPVRITPVFGQVWPPNVMPQIGSVWVIFDTGFAAPITASGNNITISGWPALTVGTAVRFSNSGGALPSPLKEETDYFVQSVVSAGVYTLSATNGGGVLTLTDTGSGTNYLGVIPDGLKAWLRLRLGAMYENREEIGEGQPLMSLPFVDQLLQPYRTYQF